MLNVIAPYVLMKTATHPNRGEDASRRGPLVRPVGELEICNLCDSSPHSTGCPRHHRFSDERFSYTYSDSDGPGERGPAEFWVVGTFAAAARSAGVAEGQALIEGIEEFALALSRGELKRHGF